MIIFFSSPGSAWLSLLVFLASVCLNDHVSLLSLCPLVLIVGALFQSWIGQASLHAQHTYSRRHARAHTHTHTHTLTHSRTHARTGTRSCAHACARAHTHTHTHTHTHYTHTHTHTIHLHTRTQTRMHAGIHAQAYAHARARILNKLNKHIDQQVVIKKGTRPTVVTPKKCSHAVCVSFSIDVHTLL